MIGEIVGLFVLLVGFAIFGALAWRLTVHLIGLDAQELTLFRTRLRERKTAEPEPVASSAPSPAPATASGPADRVDRILALLEDRAGNRSR